MANAGWLGGVALARAGVQHRIHGAGQGSRSGPAGSSQPLPMPPSLKTQISTSRARAVLQAVVAHQHVDLRMGRRSAGGVQALWGHEHRHAGAAGQQQGSSPTSSGGWGTARQSWVLRP
jgi:hypothetical protein